MDPVGLAISAMYRANTSAYTHRIVKLAECLEQRSIRCDLFYIADNPLLHKETASSLFMPFYLKKLRKYDFFYCGAEEAGHALFFCRPFIRGKIILDLHGDVIAQSSLANESRSSGRTRAPSIRVALEHRMAVACADHFLTVAKYQTDAVVREGFPKENISLVRNGVDLELFQPLPQPREAQFTFAYIGEFQTWQGIDNLMDAFERLNDPAVRMLVVGFREADEPIRRRFQEKFGPRVELVSRTDRSTIVELLKSVSILVIPRIVHDAIKHAFPTKFAEYAAMARPIMVNDVDETADFVRQYDCGFVSQPSPGAMADTMARAATLPTETLAEMGKRARHMAELNFSWNSIGDHYAEVVRSLTSGGRTRGDT
jgi:glycosyltransferase involved in cell wall biosynthesis